MKIEDAIFNWLQIVVVFEARQEDHAAKETADFFRMVLTDDFNITEISYDRDPFKYTVTYEIDGKKEKNEYDLVLVDKLISDIENEPKFRL